MNSKSKWATALRVALGTAVMFLGHAALAQFDGGTNTVTQIQGNVANATGAGTTIMTGVAGILIAAGLIFKFVRKGKGGG